MKQIRYTLLVLLAALFCSLPEQGQQMQRFCKRPEDTGCFPALRPEEKCNDGRTFQ